MSESIVNDKTQNKKFEKAMDRHGLNNNAVLDKLNSLIWTIDQEGKCTYMNRAMTDFLGTTLEKVINAGWLSYTHPEDIEMCHSKYIELIKKRLPLKFQIRLMHNSGEYRWMIGEGTPLYNSDGDFIGYAGSYLDITELKVKECLLKESESKYRMLFENMKAVCINIKVEWDDNGQPIRFIISEVNNAFEVTTGISSKDVIGKDIMEAIPIVKDFIPNIYDV